MKISSAVRIVGEVQRITQLSVGDLYKRIIPKTVYSDAKIQFGVVTDVVTSGDEVAIVTLEFTSGYKAIDIDLKTFSSDQDVFLSPATREEYTSFYLDAVSSAEDAVRTAKQALNHEMSKKELLLKMPPERVRVASTTTYEIES